MLTHIFFSGSHIWGIPYIGIIKYIQFFPYKFKFIKDFGGVSFGSIIALMLALQIPINTIEEHFYKQSKDYDFRFNDINNVINIIDDKGMESSYKYFIYLKQYIKDTYDQDDLTFIELSKKLGNNLHVTALSINTGEIELFNTDNTPDVSIIDAVCASISIPIVSTPCKINKSFYCDPCLINNNILDFFDHIPKKQILSVINKLNITLNQNYNDMNTLQYFDNLFKIILKKHYYITSLKYINDFTLVIKNHDNLINIIVNDKGILLDYNENTIDICSLYGFNLISEWIINNNI
jgi:predicted acylesterase/phospholipase RssA